MGASSSDSSSEVATEPRWSPGRQATRPNNTIDGSSQVDQYEADTWSEVVRIRTPRMAPYEPVQPGDSALINMPLFHCYRFHALPWPPPPKSHGGGTAAFTQHTIRCRVTVAQNIHRAHIAAVPIHPVYTQPRRRTTVKVGDRMGIAHDGMKTRVKKVMCGGDRGWYFGADHSPCSQRGRPPSCGLREIGSTRGTWVYNPEVESDPLGLDPNREIVHSSLYQSLRTNLPRQLMGFVDYPFAIRECGDSRNFPGHEEVLEFLNEFARDFGLVKLIRFKTEVVRVQQVDLRNDQWIVGSRTNKVSSDEVFDAVVVCVGHYTQPRLADLPEGVVAVDDNRVGPLYKHIFPPQLAPNLSFVGVPYRSTSITMTVDLQAKWIALVLSGKAPLPSKEEMMADVQEYYRYMDDKGIPKHHTHNLGLKFEYSDWLASQVGLAGAYEQTRLIEKSYFKFAADKGVWRRREWHPGCGIQDEESQGELIMLMPDGNGEVTFQDGASVREDIILHCTWYTKLGKKQQNQNLKKTYIVMDAADDTNATPTAAASVDVANTKPPLLPSPPLPNIFGYSSQYPVG
ncbi:hypothetical protein DH2020_023301 [Rehmannia glutinosa]|uniref:Flavin-containing monooxygenase n=1 Tax=Rehmannia glutinosa TaxID=99300 RepID=A0ABR0W801_REHGL